MPIFGDLQYNQYIPQYVGQPLGEFLQASSAVQDRYNKVQEGYSLIGELADTLEVSPLDSELKNQLMTEVNDTITKAAQQGNFDQMNNEMRALAKRFSKQAAPLRENLARYNQAQEAILKSELPQNTQRYLLARLRSKPGLSYDEFGIPQYLQADPFAENVDLRKAYEDFISNYKSDKYQGPIKPVYSEDGLVEYYTTDSNEYVEASQVQQDLFNLAAADPKMRAFIMQEAETHGIPINSTKDFNEFAGMLINPYANKAGFNKDDTEYKLGHADSYRAKKLEDKIGEGYTFMQEFGVAARQGIASPSELRKTRSKIDESIQAVYDKRTRFLNSNKYDDAGNLDPIDPQTGISKSGRDFSEELDLLQEQADNLERSKWELDDIEANAKRDAGLSPTWTPPKEVIDKAEKAREKAVEAARLKLAQDGGELPSKDDPGLRVIGQEAYSKSLDESNDPNTKAYAKALKVNSQKRVINRGITTFGKKDEQRLDEIGSRILAGEQGFVKATDVATGEEITNLSDYGTAVKTIGWTTKDGNLAIEYQAGEYNVGKSGAIDESSFIPSDKKLLIEAPPQMVREMIENGVISEMDLEISKQIGDFGGRVEIGDLVADVEIRRQSDTYSPTDVVVVFNNGKKRIPVPSKGEAIQLIRKIAAIKNANNR